MAKKEKLFNVPNVLTISRIILTFVVIYMIITKSRLISVIVIFGIAAFTDFLDGQIARRFNMVTEIGRKLDMIADRFLWIGTAFTFVAVYGSVGFLTPINGIQILFIMSREVISMPFALIGFFSGRKIPHARYIAKVTTFFQAFALPALMLSVFHPAFIYISFPLSLVIAVTGTISAVYYIKDINNVRSKVKSRRR